MKFTGSNPFRLLEHFASEIFVSLFGITSTHLRVEIITCCKFDDYISSYHPIDK